MWKGCVWVDMDEESVCKRIWMRKGCVWVDPNVGMLFNVGCGCGQVFKGGYGFADGV